ncbi:MAG TPA: IreB family regulatory phosphoprotein [Bacillota bacterium]|nr:IreB family regulatory phosphoprotein [Bacillota bacterium]HPE38176.1 IreB family regulatory phosphoprotein [Bacillota bacterium]
MVSSETARFSFNMDKSEDVRELMTFVLEALEEKGYNPINQLVGYFLSGDPTYITNYKGARGVIRRMERDELLEVIVREYCSQMKNKG